MIDRDELLYVVDETNRPLEPKRRYQVHGLGLWHRTSHIWVVNKRKEILCEQRSQLKDRNAGLWCPNFGGHQGAHETEIGNAIHELAEELGIEVNPSNFELVML